MPFRFRDAPALHPCLGMSRAIKRRICRVQRQFLLATLVFLLISACSRNSVQNTVSQNGTASPTVQSATSECRAIKHIMGETCVPTIPERIVTLDYFALENVLALGMKPIGTVLNQDLAEERADLRERLTEVENLGAVDQPNLEKILALKPDLILGIKTTREKIYSQLSQIAPTVLSDFDSSADWKEVLKLHAEALGKTEVAKQVMDDYYSRLEKFKAQMGDRLSQTEVSVVRITPQGLILYMKDIFIGTILEDAELPRPPAQDKHTWSEEISKERIRDADGDVIFLWGYEVGDQEQEIQTALAKLKADPLWSQLNAVKQGKVFEVPRYWIGSSILAANAVIDDLFKYLVPSEEQQLGKE